MLIFGFDPGKNGAWGAINSNGKFHFCGDMLFDDERFLSEKCGKKFASHEMDKIVR